MTQIATTSTINSSIIPLTIRDQRALFNDLYDRYGPAFYAEIKRNLYQQEICEQALTNAFKQIWENLDQLEDSKESLFIWCFHIVRKEIRKKKVDLLLKELFTCQRFPVNSPK